MCYMFFFNDPATTDIYTYGPTLSLHDALPIYSPPGTDRVRKPPDRNRRPADTAAMDLDPDACYRAISTRDARFDGRLFVGVTSTGIYCRPICPARTPKRENVRFFPSAAAAQDAGFRPSIGRAHV